VGKARGKSNWKKEFLFLVWFWYEMAWGVGLDWIGLICIWVDVWSGPVLVGWNHSLLPGLAWLLSLFFLPLPLRALL
jgi:hypothetical protein